MTLRSEIPLALLVMGAALAWAPPAASAQDDVEMLGRVHGTTPPPGYYVTRARDPRAFTFGRAWMARNPSLERVSPVRVPGEPPRFRFRAEASPGAGATGVSGAVGALATLGPPGAPVEGTFHFPLVLGYFADVTPPTYTPAEIQQEFFDGPSSRDGTIEQYYAEISGGRIDFEGETFPWRQSTLTQAQVVGSSQGLGGDARVGEFIVQILSGLDDGSVDWGRYDNDGPDGVPNSGDDDGFVDILAVMHSNWGAECGGTGADSRIWSHKWQISAAMEDPYVTHTPSANPGVDFIRVDDYTIQPVQTCFGGAINEIGVLAHELGHGFGLPDLYAVGNNPGEGIGEWGLMGSGAWGCRGGEPERPCHMSAWSKAVLGWVDVVTLDPGEDHGVVTLDPVEEGGAVYRVDAGDGSGDYFLLENRERIGFDADLHSPGLLVWQMDPGWIADHWESNTVNSMASHMGVWLRQADGRNDLGRSGGGRGDSGDPFPGSTGNTAFDAGTTPSAYTHLGAASGLTLLGIGTDGVQVSARTLTRYQSISVSLEGGAGDAQLMVDGVEVPVDGYEFSSAPFQQHLLVARGGDPAGEGMRMGFQWSDDPSAPRERTWVTGLEDASLVASFGGLEARLRVSVEGEVFGVAPGVVTLTPATGMEADGWWFPEGTVVSLLAVPNTGYGFGGWTGIPEGQPNPALVTMDGPVDAGVVFDLTYGMPENRTAAMVAGQSQGIILEAENGLSPVKWFLESGDLASGLSLQTNGLITGIPLEEGTFILHVRAQDAQGLEATGVVTLEISAPPLALADLTGPLLLQPHNLSPGELSYLDYSGNRSGSYDLGDFRSFFLGHPGGTAALKAGTPDQPLRLTVVRFPGREGS